MLVLEYGASGVLMADPAGEGLVTLDRDSFWGAWKLAERRGLSWVGLVTPTSGCVRRGIVIRQNAAS